LIQVAEQSVFMPGHLARRRMISAGTLGAITSVQVSSNHEYHAAAVMRDYLGSPFGPIEVVARSFEAPLQNPMSAVGYTGEAEAVGSHTAVALIDFGGAMGLYDFTENQWFNPLRRPRITVRGSLGELVGDRVVRIHDGIVLESDLTRRTTGTEFNLEGFDLESIAFEGEYVYRNPFVGARLPDEELCIAELLRAMGAWVRDEGPAPYPLSHGSQDHLIGLAIREAIATGESITVPAEPWRGDSHSL
jgi:predicted dehydrogenase